ncbi:winged helix DNA-binding domain-containing protein [Chondrinema litorale]|uniref:winged helix DNA-binding domain-containing protein n=1 Tax=Chondrinema litorale TaxID=2994555 RepID=UPI002543CBEF|nr:winged helix DNA-binding domain-containing protein [Chondrinema litorale]UZR97793.1 winged helix DNA-binding domain-containing protein [Chondrinema litorale]
MNLIDIARARMYNQQITQKQFKTITELVKWMGAMQAQDAAMVNWAIAQRLPHFTENDVRKALDAAEILRTHLMRPTWHVVTASDIYWILELTAPQILAANKGRHKQLELDDKTIAKSNDIIVRNLEGGKHLTREEIVVELQKAGIDTSANRASHLFMCAELEGIICSGKMKGKKQTYALLPERVPQKNLLTQEEALATLAKKYFASHGPATLKDFIWWSGLKVRDAKKALELIKADLISENVEDDTCFFTDNINIAEPKEDVFLLPAFDEYLISYTNRNASITSEHHKKAISINGIFWPIIIVDGQVKGTWKRVIKKDKVEISTTMFDTVRDIVKDKINEKAREFGVFLQKEVLFK